MTPQAHIEDVFKLQAKIRELQLEIADLKATAEDNKRWNR